MYKKKLICLAMASLLPIGSMAMAQEEAAAEATAEQAAVEVAATEAVATTTEAAAVEAAAPAPAVEAAAQEEAAETTVGDEVAAPAGVSDEAAAPAPYVGYGKRSREERWKEREQRYEELKKRAEESGVMLPEKPPWQDYAAKMPSSPDMEERMEHMKKMQAMTPEEREAYRLERYQEMRAQAGEMGMELPETPPWKQRQAAMEEEWAKHQEVIKGMTDEERAACHAMHRRHMLENAPGPMMRGPGYQRPLFQGQLPGYGYGPGPYGPRGGFWDPNQ